MQRGCDYRCTYCIVPYTRGAERSRQLADVVREAEQVVRDGMGEVVLLGQTVDSGRVRDVIAGLAGRDTIKGLGGNDTLCGGNGKDKLLGGKEKDKLVGGKGRDKCAGGASTDRARSCERVGSL